MKALEQLETIIQELESTKEDADKFDKGNGSAGTRVRKQCMKSQKDLQVLRVGVQKTKEARKTG